jgi:hypothetical protein
VPLKPGSIVEARVYSSTFEFRHHGSRIASHERRYSRLQKIFDLEHYLLVLGRKPGALRGSTPLAQWRAQGRWPESYDHIKPERSAGSRPAFRRGSFVAPDFPPDSTLPLVCARYGRHSRGVKPQ